MSEGSFWPSPFRVAIQAPRAAATPVRRAALCPHRSRCRSARSRGWLRRARARGAAGSPGRGLASLSRRGPAG